MFFYFSDNFDGIGLTCGVEDGYITELSFGMRESSEDPPREALKVWEDARGQLREYFSGVRREFDLPVKYTGTRFRCLVWDELRRIPYGHVRTYGQLAADIGRPKAARAVGGACHANPISVIVPCHRVLGADMSLTGFGGGLSVKKKLLELEGVEFKE